MIMRIIRKNLKKSLIVGSLAALALLAAPPPLAALELIIGEEKVAPGIVYIFEGAIKDDILPTSLHLPEEQTHIHIEARVNWAEENIPKGTPAGGFIPYLTITAQITNEKTDRTV